MKAFLKDFKTGEFGEYFVTADMNTTKDNCTTFEVDVEEVTPDMAESCDISITAKVSVNRDDYLFEDALLNRIMGFIEDEVDNIKEASDNIAKEESDSRSHDHLLRIYSRIDRIKAHIKMLYSVLDTIYCD